MLIQNPDTSIRYVNPALEQLTGYSLDELVNKKAPYPYWPPEKAQIYIDMMKETCWASQNVRVPELLLKKKSGDPFWIEVSAACVQNSLGKIENIVSAWIDITDRKKAQEESYIYTKSLTRRYV
jgi:PAS domain S-box-containing protein